LYAWWY